MMDDLSMIEISADGPVSLRCDACDVQIYGTAYPVTFIVLANAIGLAQRHVREAHVAPTCDAGPCFRTDCARDAAGRCPRRITDGEPITERAVFTQRDVDPLGRGNAAQHEGRGGACKIALEQGGGWVPHTNPPDGSCTCLIREACAHNVTRSADEQRSDLRKCDESALRSDGS